MFGLCISKVADTLGFSLTTISGVYRERSEKKIPNEQQVSGWKCHVDAKGQRMMARLVWDERKQQQKGWRQKWIQPDTNKVDLLKRLVRQKPQLSRQMWLVTLIFPTCYALLCNYLNDTSIRVPGNLNLHKVYYANYKKCKKNGRTNKKKCSISFCLFWLIYLLHSHTI